VELATHYWYVPAVKGWVKFDNHERGYGYEDELVSWHFAN
jgi:hypothetical protein